MADEGPGKLYLIALKAKRKQISWSMELEGQSGFAAACIRPEKLGRPVAGVAQRFRKSSG